MSAKNNSQPVRRNQLSLTGSNRQQQQQHQQPQGNKPSSGSNSNLNSNANAKNENKTINQKTDQQQGTANIEVKDAINQKDTKKQQNAEKNKQQSQQQHQQNAPNEAGKKLDKNEEKKPQNGVGKSNGNTKEKQQNGSGNSSGNDNAKEKKENPIEKNEKLTKEEKKDKDDKKEKKESENKEKVTEGNKEKEAVLEKKESDVVVEKKPENETKTKKNDSESAAEKKKQDNVVEGTKMDVSVTTGTKLPTPTKPVVIQKTVTPNKSGVKGAVATTPTRVSERSLAALKPTSTIILDDVEMKALVEDSPIKSHAITSIKPPAATSTPGKGTTSFISKRSSTTSSKSEIQSGGSSPDRNNCPRTFSQISGRRSIRPHNEYTPSYFQGNPQYRESYRRINTELDVTSNTNTSLNVTVGSEVPNNSSFSFFGRGRKRDRTSPKQSPVNTHIDGVGNSPPKRARLDVHGFFSAVASPLTMLRTRFSKTSIQSSTPVKLSSKLAAEDEVGDVQNVSGISIEEEKIHNGNTDEDAGTEDVSMGKEAVAGGETPKKKEEGNAEKLSEVQSDEKCGIEKTLEGDNNKEDDIKITETPIVDGLGQTSAKNNRCSIM